MGTVKRYLKCLRRVGVVLGRTRTHVRVAQCIMLRVASVCWNTAYIFLHSADWARYIQSPGFQHLLVTHVRKMPCKLIVCLLFLVLYSEHHHCAMCISRTSIPVYAPMPLAIFDSLFLLSGACQWSFEGVCVPVCAHTFFKFSSRQL